MPPPHEVVYELRAHLFPAQEHPEHLVAEEFLDGLDLRPGRDPEHVPVVKSSVGEQNVAVGIELEQSPEGLHRYDRTGLEICTRQGLLKVLLEGLPGAPAETAKELSVIEKRPAEDLRDAEDPVAVGYGFNDLFEEPLAEFDHTLLMAGRAEVPALAGEGQEVLVAAGIAADSSEAVMEDATVKEPIDDVSRIRPKESVLAGKAFIVDLFQSLLAISLP